MTNPLQALADAQAALLDYRAIIQAEYDTVAEYSEEIRAEFRRLEAAVEAAKAKALAAAREHGTTPRIGNVIAGLLVAVIRHTT